MMARKKKEPEPIYDHKHPYIPAGMTEIAGMPIHWLEPGEYADMSMTPEEGTDRNVYKKEYRGKLVVGQSSETVEPMGANHYTEDGGTCEYIGDFYLRKMVELAQRYEESFGDVDDLHKQRDELQDEIKRLEKVNSELNEDRESLKAVLVAAREELERLNEPEDVDSGTNNLHAAIGGQPKKVEITW